MLASKVKAQTYCQFGSGSTLYVEAVRSDGTDVLIDKWGCYGGPWIQHRTTVHWSGENLDWTEIPRPLDACPADPDRPRVGRLVWRTVGRTRMLREVTDMEPGDEPFCFGGLNA